MHSQTQATTNKKKPITLRDATISPYRAVTPNLSTKLTHASRSRTFRRLRRLLWSCRRRGYHPSLGTEEHPKRGQVFAFFVHTFASGLFGGALSVRLE